MRRVLERPLAFALFTAVVAIVVTAVMLLWGQASPERVLIGLDGRHDGPEGGDRLAGCLDCHVPFVGTPGSRCLGPGCHGELATGTPPREGPAMPVRFHAVLREEPCSLCHHEHVTIGTVTSSRTFSHDMIPSGPRNACARCHSGADLADHANTDAAQCSICHSLTSWHDAEIDHARVAGQPCDLCHAAPEDTKHATVAGNCTECHLPSAWHDRPAALP